MRRIWEYLTQGVYDEAQQIGLELGYLAGIQEATRYIDSVIASGEYEEHEDLLIQIIEDLQNPYDD